MNVSKCMLISLVPMDDSTLGQGRWAPLAKCVASSPLLTSPYGAEWTQCSIVFSRLARLGPTSKSHVVSLAGIENLGRRRLLLPDVRKVV